PALDLARLVGKRDDALAVGEEAGLAVTHTGPAGDLDESPLPGRHHEHLPARGEHDALAVGGGLGGGQEVERLLEPALAQLVEVGGQADVERRVDAGSDVEEAQVGAELVDDAPVAEARRGDLPAAVPGELPEVLAVAAH